MSKALSWQEAVIGPKFLVSSDQSDVNARFLVFSRLSHVTEDRRNYPMPMAIWTSYGIIRSTAQLLRCVTARLGAV
jgi:hypothetical protein